MTFSRLARLVVLSLMYESNHKLLSLNESLLNERLMLDLISSVKTSEHIFLQDTPHRVEEERTFRDREMFFELASCSVFVYYEVLVVLPPMNYLGHY